MNIVQSCSHVWEREKLIFFFNSWFCWVPYLVYNEFQIGIHIVFTLSLKYPIDSTRLGKVLMSFHYESSLNLWNMAGGVDVL